MNSALILLGMWLMVDGAGSIIKYVDQSLPEQLVRVIRIFIGIYLFMLGAA